VEASTLKTPLTPLTSKLERAAEAVLVRYIYDLLRTS